MEDVDAFLDQFGLIAVCAVLAVKAAGVPIPVPGDVILLATAARAAQGKYVLWQAFAALLLAVVGGGIAQFLLARGPGRGVLYRFGRSLGITPARLDSTAVAVRHGGPLSLGLAIFTPGVRAVTIAACGLALLPLRTFVPGLILGSTADLGVHFAIGYLGGPVLAGLLEAVPAPLLVVVGLLLIGLVAWIVIRKRQRPSATLAEVVPDALATWHQATCPACLAVGAVDHRIAGAVEAGPESLAQPV